MDQAQAPLEPPTAPDPAPRAAPAQPRDGNVQWNSFGSGPAPAASRRLLPHPRSAALSRTRSIQANDEPWCREEKVEMPPERELRSAHLGQKYILRNR